MEVSHSSSGDRTEIPSGKGWREGGCCAEDPHWEGWRGPAGSRQATSQLRNQLFVWRRPATRTGGQRADDIKIKGELARGTVGLQTPGERR